MLTLSNNSIKWALKHALNYGDTDIFPKIFEFDAIQNNWDDIENWILKSNILEWNIRPARKCITPKHRYGFRVATQIDPIDFIIFSALIYEIGKDIERKRVSSTKNIVHSYRFDSNSDGQIFSKSHGYDTFLKTCLVLSKQNYSWVVVADIADFFPRLYHHRVKNAILNSTRKNNHAIAIDRLLNGWSESNSYGIPVGSSVSRLLSEIALDDVDKALLSEQTIYIRFSDDFRIFCKTKREAYEKLTFLANILIENHGLTLQQHKTKIMPNEAFVKSYLSTEKEEELNRLSDTFKSLLLELGIEDPYGEIDWNDLSQEQQDKISNLNLKGIIKEQAELEEINIPLSRSVLRRLAQIGSSESLDMILDNIDKLYPIVPEVVKYFLALQDLNTGKKQEIGEKTLNLLNNSVITHLEFHRMWLLSLFTSDMEYNNEMRFSSNFNEVHDQFSQREIILALGRSKQDSWFRMRKRYLFDFSPWLKRALLMGGSCMPVDERNNWYGSLENRLDPLELAIIKWAKQNPFA
jgi:hypothetical protein